MIWIPDYNDFINFLRRPSSVLYLIGLCTCPTGLVTSLMGLFLPFSVYAFFGGLVILWTAVFVEAIETAPNETFTF